MDNGFNTPEGVEGFSRLPRPKWIREQLIRYRFNTPEGVEGFSREVQELRFLDMTERFNTPEGVEGFSS